MRTEGRGVRPCSPGPVASVWHRGGGMSEAQPLNVRRSCGFDFLVEVQATTTVSLRVAKGWEQNEAGYWFSPARAADARSRLRPDASRAKALKRVGEGISPPKSGKSVYGEIIDARLSAKRMAACNRNRHGRNMRLDVTT
jgi:hypothetical protein